jgi:hypothetical protein
MEMEHNKRNKQKSRWRELFRGTDLRRTEIACITFIIQNANGVIFTGNTVYVFEQVSQEFPSYYYVAHVYRLASANTLRSLSDSETRPCNFA